MGARCEPGGTPLLPISQQIQTDAAVVQDQPRRQLHRANHYVQRCCIPRRGRRCKLCRWGVGGSCYRQIHRSWRVRRVGRSANWNCRGRGPLACANRRLEVVRRPPSDTCSIDQVHTLPRHNDRATPTKPCNTDLSDQLPGHPLLALIQLLRSVIKLIKLGRKVSMFEKLSKLSKMTRLFKLSQVA